MKRPGILLTSLALNLILAVALFVLRGQQPASQTIQVITVSPPAPERGTIEEQPFTTNRPATVSQLARFHWRLVESADYHQYIANLRAIGCPERLIRDIIIADVAKLYAGKIRELNSVREDWQPWHGSDRRQARNRERSARVQALQAEQKALLKDLLDIERNEQWDDLVHGDDTAALALGFLSETQASGFLSLIEDFSGANREIEDKARGILLAEDREQLARVRQDMLTRLAALMTPAEFEELSLRAQGMGKFMEGDIHLEGVTLSGSEFRQLCGLSRLTGDVIQDELLRDHKELSEEEEERQQQAFEAEVKKLLGLARFADFQRAQQPEFREAFEFTEEHHLPLSTATKIGEAMRRAGEQANEIKQNQSLSPEEQIDALTVLKSVTVNALSSALGPKYAEYARTKGAELENLIELPPTTVGRRP